MGTDIKKRQGAMPVGSSNLLGFPPILDACCGSRMMWYDRKDSRAVFSDRRRETHTLSDGRQLEVNPDVLADFTALPFPDNTFALVVLDPPHCRRLEALGDVTKKYGVLIPGWEEIIRAGFEECFRVLRPEGVLIFKWCSVEVPLKSVLALTEHKPLFGHHTAAKATTHWMTFMKPNETS